MKINTDELRNALLSIKQLSPSKSSVDANQNVHLQYIENQNTLIVSGRSMSGQADVEVQVKVSATEEFDGPNTFEVEFSKLDAIAREYKSDFYIQLKAEITPEGTHLVEVHNEAGKFTGDAFRTSKPAPRTFEDFHFSPGNNPQNNAVSRDELQTALSSVQKAMPRKSERPHLQGAFFNTLNLIEATDGHLARRTRLTSEHGFNEMFFPKHAVGAIEYISRVKAEAPMVYFQYEGNQPNNVVRVNFGGIYQVNIIDPTENPGFPDLDRMLPDKSQMTEWKAKFMLDVDILQRAIESFDCDDVLFRTYNGEKQPIVLDSKNEGWAVVMPIRFDTTKGRNTKWAKKDEFYA